MRLLDPEAAILAGAIAAPLLTLLYFLKLRRRRLRVGSTLLWQRAVQDLQVNEPFRWLKLSVLLFLQLLALALLAIALGRPTVPGAGAATDRVILVIDRSASMRALDGIDGSRFDEAITEARKLINDLSSGASVQIVSFAASPRIDLPSTTDASAALRALDRLTPTDQPGDLSQALSLAETLITRSTSEEDQTAETSVIIFSDGGSAQGEHSLAGAQADFRRVGPPPQPGYDNLGITRLSVSSDFDDPSISRVFVRVQNALDREVAAVLTLSGESGIIERTPIRVPPRTVDGLGTHSMTFELDRGFAGLITARIDRDDLLEADNTAHAIIAPASRPRVLLVTPALADEQDADLAWVVRNALEEMELESLRVISPNTLAREMEQVAARADLVVFNGADVPEELTTDVIAFGGDLPGASIRSADEGTGQFSAWSRAHPIMRGLALDDVRIARPVWFELVNDVSADELASGVRGPSIVLITTPNARKLCVAFEPAQSNWPLEISFYLFLAQAIEHLAFEAGADQAAQFTTDQRAAIAVESGEGELVLTGPIELRGPITATPGGNTRTARFGVIERAGVYTAQNGRPVLSVNIAQSDETALTTTDTVRIGGRSVRTGEAAEGRREVWQWFVLAATLVLTLEWFVFARRMRA